VIEKQVKLNGSFGSTELRPREKGQAQRNGGAIEGKQFILEAKFAVPWSGHPTDLESLVKQITKHLPWSVGVGIGKG
jgi:hypothetical protein